MQVFTKRTVDYVAGGYRDPVRAFVERSYKPPSQNMVQRYITLLSAGIARAPGYERNWLLASLFPPASPAFANAPIAEAVHSWLRTGRVMPVPVTGLSRYQLEQKRGAHWVYETYTPATLLEAAWRRHPPLEPILVEGSPDIPYLKTIRSLSAVRRTHHFVLLQMGGRLYVIDGARGVVFDSLTAYLDAVMLPGHWGESSVRMKWFRIFDGGREIDRNIASEDSWESSVM
jgi:hypothetical protein